MLLLSPWYRKCQERARNLASHGRSSVNWLWRLLESWRPLPVFSYGGIHHTIIRHGTSIGLSFQTPRQSSTWLSPACCLLILCYPQSTCWPSFAPLRLQLRPLAFASTYIISLPRTLNTRSPPSGQLICCALLLLGPPLALFDWNEKLQSPNNSCQ
jgi:hypothetical protein